MMSVGGNSASQGAMELWRIPGPVAGAALESSKSTINQLGEDDEEEEGFMEEDDDDECGYGNSQSDLDPNSNTTTAGSHRRKKANPTRLREQTQQQQPATAVEADATSPAAPNTASPNRGTPSDELTCGGCTSTFNTEAELESHQCRGAGIKMEAPQTSAPVPVSLFPSAVGTHGGPLNMRPALLLESFLGATQAAAAAAAGGALPLFPQPQLPLVDVDMSPAIHNNNNNNSVGTTQSSPLPAPKDDDYCEICEKHFCNKYYLRKHKADVHGIQSEPFSAQLGGPGRRKMVGNTCGTLQSPIQVGEPQRTSPTSIPTSHPPPLSFPPPHPVVNPLAFFQHIAHMSSATSMLQQFANHSFLQPPVSPFIPPAMPPVSDTTHIRSPTSSAPSASSDISKENGTTSPLGSAVCNICHKDFFSRALLKAHKINKHGIFNGEDVVIKNSPSSPPSVTPGLSEMPTLKPSIPGLGCLEMPLPPPLGCSAGNAFEPEILQCPLCKLDFSSKLTLKAHCASIHGITSPLGGNSPIPSLPPSATNSHATAAAVAAVAAACASNLNSPPPGVQMSQPTLNQLSNSSAGALDAFHSSMLAAKLADRVTCDICKKDVCNKYFLKTHKMKVHGIPPWSCASVASSMSQPQPAMSTAVASTGGATTPTEEAAVTVSSAPIYNASMPIDVNSNGLGPMNSLVDYGATALKAEEKKPQSTSPLAATEGSAVAEKAPLNASELIKMGIDPEAYCEICKKELCSKYFLKTHKHNIHGIIVSSSSPTSTTLSGGVSTTPPLSGANIGPCITGSDIKRIVGPGGQPLQAAGSLPAGGLSATAPSSINTPSSTSSTSSSSSCSSSSSTQQRVKCDICHKELCNKYFLRTHKLKRHKIMPTDGSIVVSTASSMVSPTCKMPRMNGAIDLTASLMRGVGNPMDGRRWMEGSGFESIMPPLPHAQPHHLSPHSQHPNPLPPPPTPLLMGGSLHKFNQPMMPVCHLCGLMCPDEEKKRLHIYQEHGGDMNFPIKSEAMSCSLGPPALGLTAAAAAAAVARLLPGGAAALSTGFSGAPDATEVPLNLSVRPRSHSEAEDLSSCPSTPVPVPSRPPLALHNQRERTTSAGNARSTRIRLRLKWARKQQRKRRQKRSILQPVKKLPLAQYQCQSCRRQFTFASSCRRHFAECHSAEESPSRKVARVLTLEPPKTKSATSRPPLILADVAATAARAADTLRSHLVLGATAAMVGGGAAGSNGPTYSGTKTVPPLNLNGFSGFTSRTTP